MTNVRWQIANVPMQEPAMWDTDNLVIALCNYFSDHPDRPEGDEDGESGWGQWVEEQVERVLDRLVAVSKGDRDDA